MKKITFIGAGSLVFAKNVLGDCILNPLLSEYEIALYDIDHSKLEMIKNILLKIKKGTQSRNEIRVYHDAREALRGASFVINAILVGGEQGILKDFDIPKKYGLRQTIADTLGIGGIFRALRTIPVVMEYAKMIEEVCPNALFLNYVNPVAMISGAMQKATSIKTIGLCHSVQRCASKLLGGLKMGQGEVVWKIAGINHQSWLLQIERNGQDLYPEIKRLAKLRETPHNDMVRYEIMKRFDYFVTESSTHSAEYYPYFIKNNFPDLIEKYNIPLDAYIKHRSESQTEWEKLMEEFEKADVLQHEVTQEYASSIMQAIITNRVYKFNGNILNTGIITNLPANCCVEVPCTADGNGIMPIFVGDLPEQCAAVNRTAVNVQLLTIEAALSLKKENIYLAAMMDPHTSAELPIDSIVSMCDELIEAHGDLLPQYI